MEIDDNFTYLDATVLENLTAEDPKYIELSEEIAKDIKTNKITILDVIKKLGCLLLSESFSKRDLGVLLLSETLCKLENGSLNNEQLFVLSTYFCEKLKDHHQVAKTALRGVLALICYKNIPSESIVELISHIFNQITCQQQLQQDRYLIFQIYETVLVQHTNEVNLMGIDFVYGVISSIDGERDPKNLIYLFSWLQTFLKTVKLGHLTEEMFEVLSCYFPVDFKAPPSDKNKITREDLAQGLCKCLICIADFGQHSIPLALEKLDSALRIAKVDSLDILKLGCRNYDTQIYYQHSVEIWSQIQKEIFNTSDPDLRQKCLHTLKEVICKLSQGDEKNFENIVIDIVDTLKGSILPDSKLFSQSTQILLSVARASELSSVVVAKKVAPLLENTFKITSNTKHKAHILGTFTGFVRALVETRGLIDLGEIEEIATYPFLCYQAIIDRDSDIVIEGYKGYMTIAQYIPEDLCQSYLQNLRKALTTPLKTKLRLVVLTSLEKVAEMYPKEVERYISDKSDLCDIQTIDCYLESLSNIVQLPYFQEYVIDTLLGYTIQGVESSTVALKHLNNILFKFNLISEVLLKKDFITVLLDFLVTLDYLESSSVQDFYEGITAILQNIIRNQNPLTQKNMYLIFSSTAFKNQNIYLMVLSGFIVPLQRGVFKDYEKIEFLLQCSLNASDEFIKGVSLQVLANILNKMDNESVLEDKLNEIKTFCDSCNSKVSLISWTTKSLVTRNHPQAWHWTDLLLNCLQESEEAAKGFKLIMDENYQIISRTNYCQIMPLHKQKFFLYCTNKLNERPLNDNSTYLNAVGYLIEGAPKPAFLNHFKKIFRLILLCLEKGTEANVLEILIQRITDFVYLRDSIIEDSLEDILLRIISLTKYEASMSVRIAAIRFLYQTAITYKVYQLLPYQQRVIQQLGLCVDDKKRLVRREAMECRSLWYLLDAPE